MLRPFAIGLCIMFFPTVVLGTINSTLSPVVQGKMCIRDRFKGLKAQYLFIFCGGLLALFVLFVILYMVGIDQWICIGFGADVYKRQALALAGGGLSLRSREAFQNCGAVIRSGGLCRQSAKSKVI